MIEPGRAPRKFRTKRERTERRARVGALLLEGRSFSYIAETIDISLSTAVRDVKACEEEWKKRQAVGHEARVSRQLAMLDRIDMELWDAWARSKQPKEKRVAKNVTVGEKPAQTEKKGAARAGPQERSEASLVTEGQVGDPRFLMGLLRSFEERSKTLGTYAPTRSVEEIYLGVDAVFSDDTVDAETEKMRQLLKEIHPVGMLPAPADGNGLAPGGEMNGAGTGGGEEGNGAAT